MLSARLQSKLDGTIAEYRNEIQSITSQKDEVVGKNKVLRRKKKDLEKTIERLGKDLTDWKCAFYREKNIVLKYELERQMQLCIDGDTNLIKCMQSLRRVNDENEGSSLASME